MNSDNQDADDQAPEVSSSRIDLPDDPNDEYFLTNCFVCQEQAKPGQVRKISIKINTNVKLRFLFKKKSETKTFALKAKSSRIETFSRKLNTCSQTRANGHLTIVTTRL